MFSELSWLCNWWKDRWGFLGRKKDNKEIDVIEKAYLNVYRVLNIKSRKDMALNRIISTFYGFLLI